jgi:hypothetical protein
MWRNHCSYEPAASENCKNNTFIQFLCEYLRHLIFTSRRSNNADARRLPIEKQWIHPLPSCIKAPSHKAEINCTKNKAYKCKHEYRNEDFKNVQKSLQFLFLKIAETER